MDNGDGVEVVDVDVGDETDTLNGADVAVDMPVEVETEWVVGDVEGDCTKMGGACTCNGCTFG